MRARASICCLGAGMALAALAVTVTPIGEFPLPGANPGESPPPGLSGLTRVGGDLYYAVRDKGGILQPMTIRLDRTTGMVTGCVFGAAVSLGKEGRRDFECVAWDDANRWVWVGDENDGSIRAFHPVTGEMAKELAVPPVYGAFRFNRSFESLSIRANGLEMWTCNEDALCRSDAVNKDGPPVDDGPRVSRTQGSLVRIQRFARTAPQAAWTPAGQWAYRTDPIGGANFIGKARSGVAEMCCLDDGTILALEREMSVKKGEMFPSFRCRIYELDFTAATDVSDIASLNGAEFRPAAKKILLNQHTGFAMYEGMCLGPLLVDGSRSLLMVSDGDAGAVARLYSLKLVADAANGLTATAEPVPPPGRRAASAARSRAPDRSRSSP